MTTRIAPGVGANLLGQHSAERNQDATAYVGNLDPQVTEELLWHLFGQFGTVNVYLLKDRVTNLHHGHGFVEFRSEEDADNAIKGLNMFPIYDIPIRVNKTSESKKRLDVGANLFVGNLDPDVDEKLMYDTFSSFGVIATNPKITRDPETGNSRGFGFISYDYFEASDAAIESLNGQYLCNRQITVSYAYKKDTKGERHGTPAERTLARRPPTLSFPLVPPPPQSSMKMGVLPPQWQKQQMGHPQGMQPQHLQQFRQPKPSIQLPPSNMKVQMMNIPLPLQASEAVQTMNIPPPPQAGIAGTLVYYSICYPESS